LIPERIVPEQVSRRQLRAFGLIVGAGFGVIALWPLLVRDDPPRAWALVIAGLLGVAAVVLPQALRRPHRVWMAVGEVLAWINTRVILGVVYFGLVVPMGMVLRLSGHDPMQRRLDPGAATYRVLRARRPPSHMRRQF
jgi:hypothetical protein